MCKPIDTTVVAKRAMNTFDVASAMLESKRTCAVVQSELYCNRTKRGIKDVYRVCKKMLEAVEMLHGYAEM